MPKVSSEQKNMHRARVRALLAIDHNMSLREMQVQLERSGMKFALDYISKHREAIFKEHVTRIDRKTLNSALAVVEDTLGETVRIAWRVALNEQAKPRERMRAIAEIRKAHVDMFNLMFDAGIFQRQLGTMEHEIRNAPLKPEKKAEVTKVLQLWGLLPKSDEPQNDTANPKLP